MIYVIESPVFLHEKNNMLDIFDRPSRNAGGKGKKCNEARREHLDGLGSNRLPRFGLPSCYRVNGLGGILGLVYIPINYHLELDVHVSEESSCDYSSRNVSLPGRGPRSRARLLEAVPHRPALLL
jgi:hypothetical protein